MHVQVNQQGTRGISPQALNILRRAWKHKTLPPCIKTFAWRLIRRAIATGGRARNLTSKVNKHCTICNLIENDSHLFFHCNFARAIWFSASPPLLTSVFSQELDGVQDTMSITISPETTDKKFQRITTTLWYIWKAQNGIHFHNKKWSILQYTMRW